MLVTDALRHFTQMAYDEVGNVEATIDERLYETHYIYDALNRPTVTTEAVGTPEERTSLMAYDAVGNMVAYHDPLDRLSTYGYDVLDRNTVMTAAVGTPVAQTTRQFYDERDRVFLVVDGTGQPTWLGYDALDRVTQVIDARGNRSASGYDERGNVAWMTDALGNVTRYTYDRLDRQVAITDARGGVTRLAYDVMGNLITLTDSENNTTRWRYDLLGREIERTDPLGQSVQTSYDLANRVASITDRLGRRREFQYDHANRLEYEYWYDPSNSLVNTLSFTYDDESNLLTASDDDGTYTFSNYDGLNRPETQQDLWGLTLTFGYDDLYRTSVSDSLGGTVSSVYDAAGRLERRTFDDGTTPLRIDLGYSPRNELLSVTRFSDLDGTAVVGTSSYGYDGVGNLTDLHHRDASGTTISHYVNTFDELNRLSSEQRNGETPVDYSYDALSQLTGDGAQGYSYDLNGNRTMDGYDTDPGNRLQSDGTWNYEYDAYGRMTVINDGSDTDEVVNFSSDDIRTTAGASVELNPFAYTGQRFDQETHLFFYKNRYYNADLGRFVQRDMRGYAANDMSLYRYVDSSPTTTVDPWGLSKRRKLDLGEGYTGYIDLMGRAGGRVGGHIHVIY